MTSGEVKNDIIITVAWKWIPLSKDVIKMMISPQIISNDCKILSVKTCRPYLTGTHAGSSTVVYVGAVPKFWIQRTSIGSALKSKSMGVDYNGVLLCSAWLNL